MCAKIEKKRVSILGCGWLGFPLAKQLLTNGIAAEVKGSTTSAEKVQKLEAAGISPVLMSFDPMPSVEPETLSSFLATDILVIAIPPRMAALGADNHLKQIEYVLEYLPSSPIQSIIYISTTSIYPDLNRTVTENDVTEPVHSAQPPLIQTENRLKELRPDKQVSVLRLGGLLGYERIPGKYVKGQKNLTTGNIPVNYIHRDDAVSVICSVIDQGIHDETYNVVAPLHPIRASVYLDNCQQFGWEAPTFDNPAQTPPHKIVSSEKLTTDYEISFKYPDPLGFHFEMPYV